MFTVVIVPFSARERKLTQVLSINKDYYKQIQLCIYQTSIYLNTIVNFAVVSYVFM